MILPWLEVGFEWDVVETLPFEWWYPALWLDFPLEWEDDDDEEVECLEWEWWVELVCDDDDAWLCIVFL